jgi:hypothetical protein
MAELIDVTNYDEKKSLFYLNNPELLLSNIKYGFDKLLIISTKAEQLTKEYSSKDYNFLFDIIIKIQALTLKYQALFNEFLQSYKQSNLNKDDDADCQKITTIAIKDKTFCVPAVNYSLKAILNCFNGMEIAIDALIKKYDQCYIINLITEASRLSVIDSISIASIDCNPNDIFYQPPGSEDWAVFKSVAQFHVIH